MSSWTVKDLCRLVEARFGVRYQESGMLKLPYGLGLSWQKTRPAHPCADAKAQAAFKKLRDHDRRDRAAHPEVEEIEVWFQML